MNASQDDAAQRRPVRDASEQQLLQNGVHGSDADAAGHEDQALARGGVGRAAVGAVEGEPEVVLLEDGLGEPVGEGALAHVLDVEGGGPRRGGG